MNFTIKVLMLLTLWLVSTIIAYYIVGTMNTLADLLTIVIMFVIAGILLVINGEKKEENN